MERQSGVSSSHLTDLLERFRARPGDLGAQCAFAEALIGAHQFQTAIQVLEIDAEGTVNDLNRKSRFLSIAYDGVGRAEDAGRLNRHLMTEGEHRAWAMAAEAARYAAQGREDCAIRCFLAALNCGLLPGFHGGLYQKEMDYRPFSCEWLFRLYPAYRPHCDAIRKAFTQAYQRSTCYGARLNAPDPIFGRAKEGYGAETEQIIQAVLSAHWRTYQAGDTPKPAHLRQMQTPSQALDGRRVLIALSAYAEREGVRYESELAVRKQQSARSVGMDMAFFDTSQNRLAQRPAFEQAVAAHRPGLVLMEAEGHAENLRALGEGFLLALKEKYRFKLAVFASDPHDYFPNDLLSWDAVADVILTFPNEGLHLDRFRDTGRCLEITAIGLPESHMHQCANAERDLDFFFAGSAYLNRAQLVHRVAEVFETKFVQINNSVPAPTPLTPEDYLAHLRRAKLTVNSGRINEIEAFKGRSIEAIGSGVLNLECDNTLLPRLYIPFIHYVPVANLDQAVQFARFFKANPDWRARIAEAGRVFHAAHYHHDAIWSAIWATAGLGTAES